MWLTTVSKSLTRTAFLYAMVLTGGVDTHPAFAALPAPNPQAHIH